MSSPIQLAVIGAGIFARDAHIPAILAAGEAYQIKVICARTQESAQRLAGQIPYAVETSTDVDAVLARPDIDAVDIVVPIAELPTLIEKALMHGKHIISEKPIAPDVATGRRLLPIQPHGVVWMVAENYRYNADYDQMAELIRSGEIGKPLLVNYTLHFPVTPDSKYFNSIWRNDSSFRGGWILDGGVHHVAALRMILGEIVEVSASTARISSDFDPGDTLVANLKFASGLLGTYSVSYAAGPSRFSSLSVRGESGTIRLEAQGIEIIHDKETRTLPSARTFTVDAEFRGFAEAIQTSKPHRSPPQQALQDLAVVEAMLDSAETGKRIIVEQFVGNSP
jgi:predicted dehydrogenase